MYTQCRVLGRKATKYILWHQPSLFKCYFRHIIQTEYFVSTMIQEPPVKTNFNQSWHHSFADQSDIKHLISNWKFVEFFTGNELKEFKMISKKNIVKRYACIGTTAYLLFLRAVVLFTITLPSKICLDLYKILRDRNIVIHVPFRG